MYFGQAGSTGSQTQRVLAQLTQCRSIVKKILSHAWQTSSAWV